MKHDITWFTDACVMVASIYHGRTWRRQFSGEKQFLEKSIFNRAQWS